MSLWHHWLHLKTTSPGWTANESSPPRESSIVAFHDIIAIVAHIDIIAIITYHDMITIREDLKEKKTFLSGIARIT